MKETISLSARNLLNPAYLDMSEDYFISKIIDGTDYWYYLYFKKVYDNNYDLLGVYKIQIGELFLSDPDDVETETRFVFYLENNGCIILHKDYEYIHQIGLSTPCGDMGTVITVKIIYLDFEKRIVFTDKLYLEKGEVGYVYINTPSTFYCVKNVEGKYKVTSIEAHRIKTYSKTPRIIKERVALI